MPRTIRIAAALLVDGERTLLVRKRGTTAFMQPGGKIEPDETPVDALVRELREELGLEIGPAALSHLGQFSAVAANEPDCTVEAELFALTIAMKQTDSQPLPAAEIEEMIWLDPKAIGGVNLAPLTRDVVLALRQT
jgi:8-oxo-dGTP pyrophosphatase MutT (NUDIX family)